MTAATPARAEGETGAEALWVGDWQVLPELNRIARHDASVRLEPKAMALLLVLAERPHRVVSRDELLDAVWPGLVVGDNALTQVVIKLRKALGDTAREPAYVESIAKKGYRLVADVRRAPAASPAIPAPAAPAPAAPAPAAAAPAPDAPTRARAWGTRIAFGAAAGAALVGIVAWLMLATPADAPSRPGELPSGQTTEPPTVLVRPFEGLGEEAREPVLARAISADLVTDLSKLAGLRVASASALDAADARSESTRADYVLTGTVQRESDRLRLNVLLADARSGRPLWSERFDRPLGDLFAVQDGVVKRVLEVLPVKLTEAETDRLARRHTRNLQAYEHFMRGQAALLVRRPAQNAEAREAYWEAIRLDPAFARAYAGVALTHALAYQQGWEPDGDATLGRALALAETALRMRPDLPEAYWVRAFVRVQRRQHAEASQDLERALQLNPSYADAYALQAGIHTYLGEPAASIPLLRTALRLNPDAGSLYFLLLGRAYYFLGDVQQARVNLAHALERNAESLEAHLYLAATHWHAKDADAARWQVNEVRTLEPRFDAARWLATYPLSAPAQAERLKVALAELGL